MKRIKPARGKKEGPPEFSEIRRTFQLLEKAWGKQSLGLRSLIVRSECICRARLRVRELRFKMFHANLLGLVNVQILAIWHPTRMQLPPLATLGP